MDIREQIAELRGKTGHVDLRECADTMERMLAVVEALT